MRASTSFRHACARVAGRNEEREQASQRDGDVDVALLWFPKCIFIIKEYFFLHLRSEEKSPQWLKELKSKKRQSHYENQV